MIPVTVACGALRVAIKLIPGGSASRIEGVTRDAAGDFYLDVKVRAVEVEHIERVLPRLGADIVKLGLEDRVAAIGEDDRGHVRAFARLRADLEARGIWDDAVVVLTADHGEEFWDHGDFEHGHTLFSELIHVPLIVKAPRSAGLESRVVDAQVRVLDTLPTVFDLCDLPEPGTFSGSSLLPLMRGESEPERAAFSEATLYGHEEFSWRTERWHLILDLDPERPRPEILIDREGDPAADVTAENPEVAAALRDELEAFAYRLQKEADANRDADIENMGPTRVNEYLRSLESLGYTGREEDDK